MLGGALKGSSIHCLLVPRLGFPSLGLLAEEAIDPVIGEVDEDLFGEQRVAEALLVGVADIAIDRAIRIFEGIEYAGGIGFRGVKERGDEVIATVIALLLLRRAAGYTQECKEPKQGSRNLIHAAKLRKKLYHTIIS